MSAAELKNAVLPALLTGIRGRSLPKPFGAADGVQLLALTAHALRIDPPQPPETFFLDDATEDDRRFVPEDARALVLRIAGAGVYVAAGGRMHAAMATAIAARGMKLHPFDLPQLETFVEKHAATLGPEALAFAQRDAAPEQKQSYFAVELMNDDNWLHGNRGEKAKFIARRRDEAPEAGLALVEDAWRTQDVESKVRLLSALRVQSNPSDVPFLRTLLKERSPRIKDAARALLARLPGYDGDNPNLREALSRIESRRGDPSRLELRLPPGVSHYGSDEWIVSTFTGFGINELAEAKEMSVEALVRSAVPNERLLCGLMVSATNDGRFDVIAEITDRHLPTMEMFLLSNEIPGVESLTADERIEWLRAALPPKHMTDLNLRVLERIYDLLEGPVPLDLGRALLAAPVLRNVIKTVGQLGIDHYEMLAIISPTELRDELRSMIHLNPHAASAIQFLDLIEILEK